MGDYIFSNIRDIHHNAPCPYCKRRMDRDHFQLRPTRDHVIPRSRKGTVKIVCCNKCNGIKGDMMPAEWDAYMAANPGWWLLSKAERRARRKLDLRALPPRHVPQGTAPSPVIVPPELIWP